MAMLLMIYDNNLIDDHHHVATIAMTSIERKMSCHTQWWFSNTHKHTYVNEMSILEQQIEFQSCVIIFHSFPLSRGFFSICFFHLSLPLVSPWWASKQESKWCYALHSMQSTLQLSATTRQRKKRYIEQLYVLLLSLHTQELIDRSRSHR